MMGAYKTGLMRAYREREEKKQEQESRKSDIPGQNKAATEKSAAFNDGSTHGAIFTLAEILIFALAAVGATCLIYSDTRNNLIQMTIEIGRWLIRMQN
jgi:hypothetical protein